MRLTTLLCGLLIPITFLNAQSSIGIKFGVNLPKVGFKPSIDQATLYTYNGGIIFKHFEEKYAGIQLEVNYSQKGWKEIKDSLHSYNRKINYIDIPFMSHFYGGSDKVRIFLNIGPFVGYSIAAKEIIKSNDSLEIRDYSFIKTDNRVDFGIVGGLGINYISRFGIIQL